MSAEEEAQKLTQLRARVGALPADLVVAGDETAALRRFLVARKWDVDKAEGQLRSTLAWRTTEFRVAAFLAKPPLERLALVRTLMPSNPHLGFSKAGFPMSFLSLGGADLATAARELKPADMVADFVVRAEFYRAVVFPEATARAGKIIDKEVVILDVGGASLGFLKVLPLFKAVNSVGSSYFPERTVHILVLNAPRIFSSLWSILQGLVDPRTQKKVCIMSGGEQQLKVLSTYMDQALIPQCFGGSRSPPYLSGKDGAATATIFGRLDAWLAQCGAPAASATPAKAGRVSASLAAPTQAPAANAVPLLSTELPTPASALRRRSSERLHARETMRDAGPGADPARAFPESPGTTLPRKPSSRVSGGKSLQERDAAEDMQHASTQARDRMVLLLLWVASTLTFSLLLWARLAASLALPEHAADNE